MKMQLQQFGKNLIMIIGWSMPEGEKNNNKTGLRSQKNEKDRLSESESRDQNWKSKLSHQRTVP